MSRSSPAARRSHILSSPERSVLSSFLSEDRNNEASMFDALTIAHDQHESVRERAIRVFELHEMREQQRLIEEATAAEEKRLQQEKEVADREAKLRELKKKSIPVPPPEPEPVPEPPKESTAADSAKKLGDGAASSAPKANGLGLSGTAAMKPQTNGATAQSPSKVALPESATSGESKGFATPQEPKALATGVRSAAQSSSPFAQTAKAPASPSAAATTGTAPAVQSSAQTQKAAASPFIPAPPATASAPSNTATPSAPSAAATPTKTAAQQARAAAANRYAQIHQNLKQLRKDIMAESKKPGSPLKGKLGTFRREIRTSIGQLTGVKGANAQPTRKVLDTLEMALRGDTPSPMIDVSPYILHPRNPVEGAPNNETLPSLFIYLLNITAKGIISQFINECSANPKAADPIGVVAAQVFSKEEFGFRGASLIDILIAKYRVACPVLFGFRGNDKTERGRIALGWRKDGGAWVPEQAHNDRMTGLGAGFASIALRDFSRSTKKNPFPPSHYWVTFADIVNTPLNETSNTQYVILRALIEGHEKRFLSFYGNAALAALRLAFVEFPKKAPQNAAAAGSLKALSEVLKNEGLALA